MTRARLGAVLGAVLATVLLGCNALIGTEDVPNPEDASAPSGGDATTGADANGGADGASSDVNMSSADAADGGADSGDATLHDAGAPDAHDAATGGQDAGSVTEAFVVNTGEDDGGFTVTVLSIPSNQVVTTIPIGPGIGGAWGAIAISPVAPRYAYVTNSGADTVTAIDTASNTIVKSLSLGGGTTPRSVAVSPDGKNVAVAEYGVDTVVQIDTTTWVTTPIAQSDVNVATGVQYKPDGSELWVGAYGPNLIRRFAYPGYAWIGDITEGSALTGDYIRFFPDSSEALVGNTCGCCGNVQEISPAGDGGAPVWNQTNPNSGPVALSADAGAVFTSNIGTACGASNIVKYDAVTHGNITSYPVGAMSTNTAVAGIVATPDGQNVYATLAGSSPSQLFMLDANTLALKQMVTLTGQSNPWDIAILSTGAGSVSTPDAGAPDAGAPDAGAPDAGATDAGATDAGNQGGGGGGLCYPFTSDSNTILLEHFDDGLNTGGGILAYDTGSATCPACGTTITSATASASWVTGAPPFCGDALDLAQPNAADCSSTYVEWSVGQLLSQTNGTVELWVNPTSYAGWSWFVLQAPSYRSCAGVTFYMSLGSTGQLQGDIWNGCNGSDIDINSGSTLVPLGTWTQVAFSWGSQGASLYIDGTQVGTSACTGSPASGYGGQLILGDSGLSGSFDELRVSNVQRASP